MKILVAYHDRPVARAALALARDHAEIFGAKVFVVTSMEGGDEETVEDIKKAEAALKDAEAFLAEKGLACETHQVVHGQSPGEDIIWFARDNNVDLIFVGIEKKSRAQKLLLGSTAQYVILKAPCPVTTVKP
jgi:nucleotide-binding universal stress UspA family protein